MRRQRVRDDPRPVVCFCVVKLDKLMTNWNSAGSTCINETLRKVLDIPFI